MTSPGGEPWAMALAFIWGRISKGEVTEAVTGVGKAVGGWVPRAVPNLRSLTINIQEVLCHDHWPLVNGFARAIENPTWKWVRGVEWCSGTALGLSLPLTLHTTSSHPALVSQLPHVPLPSALGYPQGAGYSVCLLGGLSSSPGNLYRQGLGPGQ